MNRVVLIVLVLFATGMLQAQNLLLNGKISFERKFNVLKSLEEDNKDDEDEDNEWLAQMKKTMPRYKVDQYQLLFSPQKTLYQTVQEDDNPMFRWQKNVSDVSQLTLLDKDSTWANRTVFDKVYQVADSTSTPQWKLTGEYREIAGYNCRRATTILYDSIYVIAFYTDAIPISGGPDLYAGLPGMILGVVIPRLHTTIFATKVEGVTFTDADFVFKTPRKAIKVNRNGYRKDLTESTNDWGKYGLRFVLKALF